MLVMKNLTLTVKVRKSIFDILIARPQVKKVKMRMSTFVKTYKCAVHVRTQEYREHGKKALHLTILKNKLYLQAGMPTSLLFQFLCQY